MQQLSIFSRVGRATILMCYLAPALFASGLEDLPALKNYRAMRESSYDRTGGNNDALQGVMPGQTVTLADIAGPGMITHIWFTIAAEPWHGRKIVLRMFWDDEQDPSVLCPINDFFCAGHGINAEVRSMPIVVTSEGRARNCWFKMPFNKRARIEIVNEGLESIGSFYYYIDYRKYDRPFKDQGYFHARYRQEYPAVSGRHYMICDAVGRGHFVGCNISIESNSDAWWGEGDDRIFVDGEKHPSFHGTGSEDYLCDAWGIWPGDSLYYGTTIFEGPKYIYDKDTRFTSYRFHIADPIPFTQSLYFEIEHYGAQKAPDGKMITGFTERADNWSSVAYWYQIEPHKPWAPMAPVDQRLCREAGREIDLLRFLRETKEAVSSESVAKLRNDYTKLMADSGLGQYHLRFTAGMALAEKSAGNTEKARELLSPYAEPFVLREFAEAMQVVLGNPISKTRPLLVAVDDGSVHRVRQDGRLAIVTQRDRGRPYIYFALPEGSEMRHLDRTVVFHITTYSDGQPGQAIEIEYDSNYSNDVAGFYRPSKQVTLSVDKGWHTIQIECPRARLAGHQNVKSDFRVETVGERDIYIADIEPVLR